MTRWKLVALVVAAAVTLVALAMALRRPSSAENWPPQACAGQKPDSSTLKKATLGDYNGLVYLNSDKKKEEELGFGQKIISGQIVVPSNPLLMEKVPNGYAENSYEILFSDKDGSVLLLDPAKNDSIVIMQWERDPNRVDNFRQASGGLTLTYPGGKVRCKDQLYEIHSDGWYLNGKLVHPFAKQQ